MNDIASLIEKARRFPSLSYVYAFEIDRKLRKIGENSITFSFHGLAEECAVKEPPLGLDYIFKQKPRSKFINAIYEAEMLAQKGQLSEARAHAFTHAKGAQILALNLIYANYATDRPALRLHYLNKYLSAHGLHIELAPNKALTFFHRVQLPPPSNKVDGPLVTVIMPARNAEDTIELAVASLLNQTWRNLQIIVVDDASTDDTLLKAKALAELDSRVEVLCSRVHVGPYVCRNLGVLHTRGHWLTVHDADDWAFPDRIEQQVQALTAANALACTGRMLRMNEQGQITRPIPDAFTTEDGYLRLCFVSLMVQTAFFRNELGAWDSVRVGGDAELIERIEVLDIPIKHLHRPLMLCLDHNGGLTNNQVFGLSNETGLTNPLRADYKQAFTTWHKAAGLKKISTFGKARPFEVPTANLVEPGAIKKVFMTWAKNLELIKASELFDAAWYKSQYPESEQTGLDAAEHYLVHGSTGTTDPSPAFSSRFYLVSRSLKTNPLVHHLRGKDVGPKPKRVLLAAAEAAKTGAHELGVALAEAHLASELAYTAHILKANAALANADEAGWQEHLNAYLTHFDVAPICLDAGEGTVFDRLNTAPLPPVTDGPLVTVIMPAWNSEKTVRKASQSILNQTWHNLELLIIDDASTDGTWTVLQEIAASDARVKILRNIVNAGPYVSKNIALMQSKGEWITGHDADDWAHPKRLENHLRQALHKGYDASLTYMIRITPEGKFSHLGSAGNYSIDGTARKSAISCLFKRLVLDKKLGFWDSVRYGADSEILFRAERLLGKKFGVISQIGMICQDLESSLTNHPLNGVDRIKGMSPTRANYSHSFKTWLQSSKGTESCYLPFPQQKQRYTASAEMAVPLNDILINLQGAKK
jgi:glycosyltransferase involved in cell wall biosynthesis